MIADEAQKWVGPALVMGPIAFLLSSIKRREIIWALALRSFQSRFIGTGFGVAWSVISPLVTVLVYWLVFSLGFKARGPQNVPFVVYFMPGFLAWNFVSEALTSSVGAVVANRHLVKKMVFPTEILPMVEILASTFTHAILLGFTILLLLAYGVVPGFWSVQILYAYFCAVTLSLGLGWLLSAINVFHRDVALFLATVLNVWFWMTPIVWSADMLPESWRPFLKLNPMFHIVESYRGSLLYGRPVWSDASQLLLFWILVVLLGTGGSHVFRRLKPEFPDLL
jgi:lipopolysaccharide transport system permease protein/teichoic acid transport system permease protein